MYLQDHVEPYPVWADKYLAVLQASGLEATAASAVGMTARKVRYLCEHNQEFAYAVEQAMEEAQDRAEAEARRRGIEGFDKGVYYEGTLVATETQYSDALLGQILKGRRRKVFGDKTEISGPGNTPLTIVVRQFDPTSLPLPEALILDADIDDLL